MSDSDDCTIPSVDRTNVTFSSSHRRSTEPRNHTSRIVRNNERFHDFIGQSATQPRKGNKPWRKTLHKLIALLGMIIAIIGCSIAVTALVKGTSESFEEKLAEKQEKNVLTQQNQSKHRMENVIEMLMELQSNFGEHVEKIENLSIVLAKMDTKIDLIEMRKNNEPKNQPKKGLGRTTRKDCSDVNSEDYKTDGVYPIMINGTLTDVYCQFDGNDSWLVFQKRFSGEVNFYRDWDDYATGFGNKNGEFWLGLRNLHAITSSSPYELRIDLEDWNGNSSYAQYMYFEISDSTTNYRLNVAGYSGDAGDAMALHDGQPFTTRNRDHDDYSENNCAEKYHGAWWYKRCHHSNLNGRYFTQSITTPRGICWWDWKQSFYSMKKVSMKIKRS